MTTAHMFYIPVIFFVGLFAGFFLGRRAVEEELKKRREQLRRRKEAAEAASEEVEADG